MSKIPELPHEELKKILVDDCWLEWQDKDGKLSSQYAPPDQDVYAVVLHSKGIVYREHRRYCHIDDAYRILNTGRFGKWKTAYLLVTLRQGLRERFAQGMQLDIPPDGVSRKGLTKWFTIARHYDGIHHGSVTF